MQKIEKITNPDSEYLKKLSQSFRSYEEAVQYPPNQVYIGNMVPEDLRQYPMPWYEKKVKNAERFGKYGEIMPQDEFIALMKISDVFDSVVLDKKFTDMIKAKLYTSIIERRCHQVGEGKIFWRFKQPYSSKMRSHCFTKEISLDNVKRADDLDENLASDIMLHFTVKASGILALKHLWIK